MKHMSIRQPQPREQDVQRGSDVETFQHMFDRNPIDRPQPSIVSDRRRLLQRFLTGTIKDNRGS